MPDAEFRKQNQTNEKKIEHKNMKRVRRRRRVKCPKFNG